MRNLMQWFKEACHDLNDLSHTIVEVIVEEFFDLIIRLLEKNGKDRW